MLDCNTTTGAATTENVVQQVIATGNWKKKGLTDKEITLLIKAKGGEIYKEGRISHFSQIYRCLHIWPDGTPEAKKVVISPLLLLSLQMIDESSVQGDKAFPTAVCLKKYFKVTPA